MNILSTFDGMSCGQIALNKAGIKYDNYFASEIDKYAIEVTQHNYPNTKQIGSVVNVKAENLPKIDLLIGGSSCQDFSVAGKQKGMVTKEEKPILSLEQYIKLKNEGFDFYGESYLFWEYVRLLKECKPKYFFLENVVMKREWENLITSVLGVEPIKINSSLVSAQNRPRIYWTNIVDKLEIEDKGILLKDITDYSSEYIFISSEKTINRKHTKNYLQYDINGKGHGSQDQRAYYLNGKHGCLDTGASGKAKILLEDGTVRKATRIECERLQTVPDNYTIAVTESQAKSMLGNGWTVDVIVEFFKNIK
jgi:site-specific DNA-cytosine methylase